MKFLLALFITLACASCACSLSFKSDPYLGNCFMVYPGGFSLKVKVLETQPSKGWYSVFVFFNGKTEVVPVSEISNFISLKDKVSCEE